mgnify:CR=1 FL=1
MSNLRISIIGYGRMGHEIESLAYQRGVEVVSITDPRFEDTSNPIWIKYAMYLKKLIQEVYRGYICEMTSENKELVKKALDNYDE